MLSKILLITAATCAGVYATGPGGNLHDDMRSEGMAFMGQMTQYIAKMQSANSQAERDLLAAKNNITALDALVVQKDNEIGKLQGDLALGSVSVQGATQRVQALEVEKTRLEAAHAVEEKKAIDALTRISNIQASLQKAEQERDQHKQNHGLAQAEATKWQGEHTNLETALTDSTGRKRRGSIIAERDQLEAEAGAKESARAALEAQLQQEQAAWGLKEAQLMKDLQDGQAKLVAAQQQGGTAATQAAIDLQQAKDALTQAQADHQNQKNVLEQERDQHKQNHGLAQAEATKWQGEHTNLETALTDSTGRKRRGSIIAERDQLEAEAGAKESARAALEAQLQQEQAAWGLKEAQLMKDLQDGQAKLVAAQQQGGTAATQAAIDLQQAKDALTQAQADHQTKHAALEQTHADALKKLEIDRQTAEAALNQQMKDVVKKTQDEGNSSVAKAIAEAQAAAKTAKEAADKEISILKLNAASTSEALAEAEPYSNALAKYGAPEDIVNQLNEVKRYHAFMDMLGRYELPKDLERLSLAISAMRKEAAPALDPNSDVYKNALMKVAKDAQLQTSDGPNYVIEQIKESYQNAAMIKTCKEAYDFLSALEN